MLDCQRALFDMPRDVCFLNAAAWSPIPLSAVDAGRQGAERKARPWEIDPELAEHQFARARSCAARLINASPDDIALISSVGYGVSSAAKLFTVPAGHRILLLGNDHSSPTLEWMARSQAGAFDVEVVTPGAEHDWTAALLEAIARKNAKPIAMASISSIHWSDGGAIDIELVQSALKARGAALLIDATHAAGVMPLDVMQLDPDFVIFPTYKWLLGPYGRAFIYVAKRHQSGVPLEQTSYGRQRVNAQDATYFSDLRYVDSAKRFDMGERDFFVSLDVASHSIEFVLSLGIDRVRERLAMLTRRIAGRVGELDVQVLREDLRAPHVLSLGFPGGMPEHLNATLQKARVFAAPRVGRLRISPHVYNDEQDCDHFVEVLGRALR